MRSPAIKSSASCDAPAIVPGGGGLWRAGRDGLVLLLVWGLLAAGLYLVAW